MTRLPGVPRPRSLRGRSAVAAGISVLIGSLLITVVAVILVQRTTTVSLDDALASTAQDVLAQLSENPPSSGDPIQLPVLDARDPIIVQIIDSRGVPIAATPGLDSLARICPDGLAPGSSASVDLEQPGVTGTFRVLATTATTGGQQYVICTARSDRRAESTRWGVLLALGIVIASVTALVVLLVARSVGSALAAVDDLTREADRLRTLDAGRLTVPDTGDEVAHLAETLNELLDRLHAQEQSTRQFIADAGHELRTPLTSLRLELELGSAPRPGRAMSTDDALSDVDRLASLVDDLLALARSDAREPLHPEPAALPDAFVEELESSRRIRPDVLVRVGGTVPDAFVDISGLRRAMRNLLSNAVRHAATAVEVTVHRDDACVVIEVSDDGPGVPASQTAAIFERFARLDDARDRDSGGSGLGLAIVAAFAERSGGEVTACPGPGGRFVLRLPTMSRTATADTAP